MGSSTTVEDARRALSMAGTYTSDLHLDLADAALFEVSGVVESLGGAHDKAGTLFLRAAAAGTVIVALGGAAYVFADTEDERRAREERRPDGRPRLPPNQPFMMISHSCSRGQGAACPARPCSPASVP